MEDNNLSNNLSNKIIQENLNKEQNNSNQLILNEAISSQYILEKFENEIKEKEEIKEINDINKNNEIKQIQEQKQEKIVKIDINSRPYEIKEGKENSLIINLINIHKLIRKEMSTRKACKKNKINNIFKKFLYLYL